MNQPIPPPPKPGPTPGSAPSQTGTARPAQPAVGSASRGSECANCGSPRRWILHHVRIRGIHRRLCTSCVLRLHPSSFCPGCFQFYDSASVPPLSKRLTCSKCSSFTHTHCAANANANSAPAPGAGAGAASGGYLCPPCAAGSPGHALFDVDAAPGRVIDKRMALVLLCAAKISVASMSKAVVVARAEAERRVREAALARKRAREAIEKLATVVGGGVGKGEKAGRKDGGIGSGAEGLLAGEVSRSARSMPISMQGLNGFTPAATTLAVASSPAAVVATKKSENGETQAANGNISEKDKSGNVEVKKERMEIDKLH